MQPFHMANGNVCDGALKMVVPLSGEAVIEKSHQAITAAGHVTLTIGGAQATRMAADIIYFDCDGVARNLTLPAPAGWRGKREIVNTSAGAFAVTVKNSAGSTILVIDQNEGGVVFSDGTTTRGQGYVVAATSGNDFGVAGIKTDALTESTAGADITIPDGVALAIGAGKDLKIEHDGTNTTFLSAVGDLIFDNTDVNDQIIFRTGTDTSATGLEIRNNSDVAYWAFNPSSATAGTLKGADGSAFVLGTGDDDSVQHNGTDTIWTHNTGLLVFDNVLVTGVTVLRLGTDTNATALEVRNNSDVAMWAFSPSSATAGTFKGVDGSAFVLGTGNDDSVSHDGTNTTWTHTTGDLIFDSTDVDDQIIFRVGTDTTATGIEFRNNSDAAMWAINPTAAGAGTLKGLDNSALVFGTGDDDSVLHDAINTVWTHTTGNLQFDNQAAAGFHLFDLGTDTGATGFSVRNNSLGDLFKVTGDGAITAGTGMWANSPSEADPNPNAAHRFFEDFVAVLSADWAVAETDTANTAAVSDAQHGVVVLTCNAGDDDSSIQIQHAQETFRLTSGKKVWVEFRVKIVGDATQSDFFIGLAEVENLTAVADNMPANGFGFRKDDGDTNIDACSSDNGGNVESLAVAVLANDTFVRLGLLFDGGASGAATLTPYIDGVAGAPIAAVAYGTMTEVAPIFMVRNGDAVTTELLHCDYIKVVAQR